MPEITPNSKGPAPARRTPETAEPALIPADQVKPEDIATLSIEYRDGQPVVVSDGKAIPATLKVVDGSGNAVAAYAAGALNQARFIGDFVLHCHILDHEDTGLL